LRADIEIDGAGETDRFIKPRRRRAGARDWRSRAHLFRFGTRVKDRCKDDRPGRALLLQPGFTGLDLAGRQALQFLWIGWTQLLSGSFGVGEVRKLDGLTRHDRRNGMLIDELRVAVPPQEHTEIVEPGYNALQLHPVHQKNGQRRLVLADVVEKRVL